MQHFAACESFDCGRTFFGFYIPCAVPPANVTWEGEGYFAARIAGTVCHERISITFRAMSWNVTSGERYHWWRLRLVFTSAKGNAYSMIHHLKYKQRPDVGVEVEPGTAGDLLQVPAFASDRSDHSGSFTPGEARLRGYNPGGLFCGRTREPAWVTRFCRMALRKVVATSTQTRKHRVDRFRNVEHVSRRPTRLV